MLCDDAWPETLWRRFWSKVEKSEGCWLWTAGTARGGYGTIRARGGRMEYAHRVLWEFENGPVPDGLELDHTCHNSACVRPAHLRAVTHAANMNNQPGPNSRNTSGYKNVSRAGKNWRVVFGSEGRVHHVGSYPTLGMAASVAAAVRRDLGRPE